LAIKKSIIGNLAVIAISRPGKANSLDPKHMSDLARTLRETCAVGGVSLVLLRGEGRGFSAGLDLQYTVEALEEEGSRAAAGIVEDGVKPLIGSMLDCPKPIAALVHGYALGLAFELLYATDITIVTGTAKLGVPALKWGITPPLTPIIGPLVYGRRTTYKLLYRLETITGTEYYREGHASHLVEDVSEGLTLAEDIAESIARLPARAVGGARSLWGSFIREHIDIGAKVFIESLASKDTLEHLKKAYCKGGTG